MKFAKDNHGDTLIEVMLAMTLLTAILFTSWSLVNRSTQISLIARQRVVMVNQLKEQAEVLKSIYATRPNSVKGLSFQNSSGNSISVASLNQNPDPNPCEDTKGPAGQVNQRDPEGAFYFNTNATSVSVESPNKVKQFVDGDRSAVSWIQAQRSTDGSYIDFYIRGCWFTGGGTQNEDNSQLIVRLNT